MSAKSKDAEAAAKAALAKKREAEAAAEQAKLEEYRRDVPPGIEVTDAPQGIRAKLLAIQKRLRVNKDRGKGHNPSAQVTYEYRNAEDIFEAVKPFCAELGVYVKVDVAPYIIGEGVPVELRTVGKDRYGNEQFAMISGPRFAAVATAAVVDVETGERETATAFAFIDAWRKGQTEPEKLCGSADSYASKYALGHLFALDNNRDADVESDEAKPTQTTTTTTTTKPTPDLGF